MARVQVRLDPAGMRQVAESAALSAHTERVTRQIAENIRSQQRPVSSPGQAGGGSVLPVDVLIAPALPGSGISDRRTIGIITLVHPAGLGMQAKYGTLTQAAGALGLEVTERPPA